MLRQRIVGLTALMCMGGVTALNAQVEVRTEAQVTASDGDHTPLWLNANKYGLSSLETTNGYVRAGVFRPLQNDSAKRWAWGAGADVAVAANFTSMLVVQQAYGELRWLKGLLTVGSKEQPMELRNQELSSGPQTLGINARPVPSVRLSLPDYWDVPGTKGWLALKGHMAYGLQTDDRWQKDFTDKQSRYTEHTRLHTKAGYLRIGQEGRPLTVELGIEMGCQFGGTSYVYIGGTFYKDPDEPYELTKFENDNSLKAYWHAFVPGGHESKESDIVYKNEEGNHLGSYVLRVNYDQPTWGVSVYADHYYEDQSGMFFVDYDGYGSGDDWDVKKDSHYFLYDLRDIMLGTELRLKQCHWLNNVVVEYLYSKYQSGPINHDHTKSISDHISGMDNFYNHDMFTGWQHWGQVMGNPLYRSPLYNDNGYIMVKDNRMWAWHVGLSGDPVSNLHYRLLCSWQRGWGTYQIPFMDPQRNVSMLAEVNYRFADDSRLKGWSLRGALGYDHGGLLGDNVGLQVTVGKRMEMKDER
ncbi:MAG: hypothetical protein II949_00615 [Prevotella sp.]|nr:hypothetical protein [Prevotella sp.]